MNTWAAAPTKDIVVVNMEKKYHGEVKSGKEPERVSCFGTDRIFAGRDFTAQILPLSDQSRRDRLRRHCPKTLSGKFP